MNDLLLLQKSRFTAILIWFHVLANNGLVHLSFNFGIKWSPALIFWSLLSGEKGKEECIPRAQKTREQVRARGHLNTHTTNHKKSKFDDKLVCSVKGRKQEKGMLNRQGNTV